MLCLEPFQSQIHKVAKRAAAAAFRGVYAAAQGGNDEIVSTLLLEPRALRELNPVLVHDKKKRMPALHRAIADGHTAVVVALMVLADAGVSLLDSRGRISWPQRPALQYAVEGGHLRLAGNLIIIGEADLHVKKGLRKRVPMATPPFNFQPLIMTTARFSVRPCSDRPT